MTLVYAKKNATTKKGSRNVMGAELCLAHDIGGGGIGGPLSVDMRPYSCFIYKAILQKPDCQLNRQQCGK